MKCLTVPFAHFLIGLIGVFSFLFFFLLLILRVFLVVDEVDEVRLLWIKELVVADGRKYLPRILTVSENGNDKLSIIQ